MKTSTLHRVAAVFAGGLLVFSVSAMASPKGAKAIFDSGNGGTIGMSAEAPRAPAATVDASVRTERPERYVASPTRSWRLVPMDR